MCVEIINERMRMEEAMRNVGELIRSAKDYEEFEHYTELSEAILTDDDEKLKKVLDKGTDNGNKRTS